MKSQIIGLICLFAGSASAGEFEVCQVLAKDGMYDVRTNRGTFSGFEQVANWFCKSQFQDSSQAESEGARLNIPIKDILIGFGYDGTRNSFQSASQQMCQQYNRDLYITTSTEQYIKTASNVLARAFVDCIDRIQNGLTYYAEMTTDASQIGLVARYRGGDNPAVVKSIDIPTGFSCPHAPKKNDHIGAGGINFTCTRDRRVSGLLAISTTEGPISFIIDPVYLETTAYEQHSGRTESAYASTIHYDSPPVSKSYNAVDGWRIDTSTTNLAWDSEPGGHDDTSDDHRSEAHITKNTETLVEVTVISRPATEQSRATVAAHAVFVESRVSVHRE